jgi:DNA modification methylase
MTITLHEGHAPAVLSRLPAGHFHCVVTSPPYWALRRYGTRPQVWTDGWVGELGSEPTPELFVAHLVGVFDEVWRVMRDDATLWVNLGDSYASGEVGRHDGLQNVGLARGSSGPTFHRSVSIGTAQGVRQHGPKSSLPPKNLTLIPWRFALAMQEAGWYVRSVIAWTKPAPMPESVTDRPTSAWEPIFLFSKKPTYYYDATAVRVTMAGSSLGRLAQDVAGQEGSWRANGGAKTNGAMKAVGDPGTGRNLWNYWEENEAPPSPVWKVGPEPSRLDHYASYPRALVRTPIKAGTSEKGCCSVCGAPWKRVTERTPNPSKAANVGLDMTGGAAKTGNPQTSAGLHRNGGNAQGPTPVTIGWEPTCKCQGASVVPCRVLDPFAGSGTTGLVADELGRDCTLIELNHSYAEMARQRIANACPLFADVRLAGPVPEAAG